MMLLEEAQERLKKSTITQEQLWGINSLYILLDIDKDDFCKIIDVVGLEKLLEKQSHYDRLFKAENELFMKERYLRAKERLIELENEKLDLQAVIDCYPKI